MVGCITASLRAGLKWQRWGKSILMGKALVGAPDHPVCGKWSEVGVYMRSLVVVNGLGWPCRGSGRKMTGSSEIWRSEVEAKGWTYRNWHKVWRRGVTYLCSPESIHRGRGTKQIRQNNLVGLGLPLCLDAGVVGTSLSENVMCTSGISEVWLPVDMTEQSQFFTITKEGWYSVTLKSSVTVIN